MDPFIQIYILSFNRPHFVVECIESALLQDYSNFEIIVSDNSDNDLVQKAITPYLNLPHFRYVRRRPTLSPLDHFNTLLTEPSADFFMLFHDDDILLPTALSQMIKPFKKNVALNAVGGNALFLRGETRTTRLFSSKLKKDIEIFTPSRLILSYLRLNRDHPPFPSYLYKTSAVKNRQINIRHGGKYADISLLVDICQSGPLYWIKDPVLYYRIHASNDSSTVSLTAILRLCVFFKKYSIQDAPLIQRYKMKQYAVWLKQRLQGKAEKLTPWKERILKRAIFFFALKHPAIFAFYSAKMFLQAFSTVREKNIAPQK